ncbi:hypothetical protein [Roseivirga sp. E12]|uniref:hypothetical protein n=1 Tax=Roseivirga sp. E12 TaxID=2819237 RepID=UPI001ABC7E9A|nr:hypothetical protein [Roseivirga sp. E12]MBO3700406.1 hypothetical protein [Roseivirga sp. E12]
MRSKIAISIMSVVLLALTMVAPKQSQAQTTPPPTNGTCCPTQSGAICFVLFYMVDNAYYLSEGDCPGSGGGGSIGEN